MISWLSGHAEYAERLGRQLEAVSSPVSRESGVSGVD